MPPTVKTHYSLQGINAADWPSVESLLSILCTKRGRSSLCTEDLHADLPTVYVAPQPVRLPYLKRLATQALQKMQEGTAYLVLPGNIQLTISQVDSNGLFYLLVYENEKENEDWDKWLAATCGVSRALHLCVVTLEYETANDIAAFDFSYVADRLNRVRPRYTAETLLRNLIHIEGGFISGEAPLFVRNEILVRLKVSSLFLEERFSDTHVDRWRTEGTTLYAPILELDESDEPDEKLVAMLEFFIEKAGPHAPFDAISNPLQRRTAIELCEQITRAFSE
ncbi:MAG TPA: hypothetical protein VNG90_03270 [Candidatus Acidoferrum sp.]|nr:hypothetical protein [Candidatus Acidoferrum sp.]